MKECNNNMSDVKSIDRPVKTEEQPSSVNEIQSSDDDDDDDNFI